MTTSAFIDEQRHKTLLTQLTELNSRSRMYSVELWQIPFAFFGVTGIGITHIAARVPEFLPHAFALSSVFGVFVIVHMRKIRVLEQKAVSKLRQIEQELGLKQRAIGSREPHIYQYAMNVLIFTYIVSAVLLIKCA